jgi:hypothetical protein
MNKSSFVWTIAILLAGTVDSAPAHHSAAQFDFQNTVNVTGVVKVAQFANPHGKFVLTVTDEKRGTRDIEFEAHSRNNMYRQGLRPEMMAVGDKITIRIAPMRNGEDGGYVTAVLTADGTAIGNITSAD